MHQPIISNTRIIIIFKVKVLQFVEYHNPKTIVIRTQKIS